jgi:Glu-tRNA(Gln) amidotransferase subunit E-like FAD-binding protein
MYYINPNYPDKKVYRNSNKYRIDWDKKSRSNIQFNTKQYLRPFWENHIVYEEFTIPQSRLSLDIVNETKRIVIEVQGEQHEKYNKWMHGGSRAKFRRQIARDMKKEEWCNVNDFILVEITKRDFPLNAKFFKNLEIYL